MTDHSPLRRAALALMLAALAPLAMAAAVPASRLSAADEAAVQRAVAYLEGVKAARARFIQVDSKGVSRTGTFYLQRPGKARFEYDSPANQLIVSDGNNVSVVSGSLQTQQRYPLNATPLSFILGRSVRLDKAASITAVRPLQGGGFSITARDASGKTPGSVTINFTGEPIALSGWTITDITGATVQVRLTDLREGPQAAKLFVIVDPRPTGMRRN